MSYYKVGVKHHLQTFTFVDVLAVVWHWIQWRLQSASANDADHYAKAVPWIFARCIGVQLEAGLAFQSTLNLIGGVSKNEHSINAAVYEFYVSSDEFSVPNKLNPWQKRKKQ